MKVYTAQYRYAGDDRLDITIKGKDPIGKIFAPSWKMVMQSKEEKMTWDEYKHLYKIRMRKSYQGNRDVWEDILRRDEVTLVCFCPAESNCHRYLLAGYFTKFGANYMGERSL